jgi:Phospholipase_D-nuclease N-terminal
MRFRSSGVWLLGACALAGSNTIWAQNNDAGGAAGCAACGTCGGGFIFIILAWVAISVALLVWVARDAKARGMDSAVLWMLLVFFLGLIGLVIYLLARPQGNMIPCPNCGNKRLQASVKCPHCGIGS